MTLEGIDVSRWQTHTPSLAGLSFAFAKASEGTTADPMYATHMANFVKAGIVPGAYMFARDDVALDVQAAAFVKIAGDKPRLLVVDAEGKHSPDPANVTKLMALVRSHDPLHRRVGLYRAEANLRTVTGYDFLWLANYAGQPSGHWDFWQYTSSPIDRDRYQGSLAQLHALAGIGVPPAPPTDTGTTETTVKLVPGTVYKTQILCKPGFNVLGSPGGAVIYKTKAGDKFLEVGDWISTSGDYHILRMPGDIAGFLGHGMTLGTEPA